METAWPLTCLDGESICSCNDGCRPLYQVQVQVRVLSPVRGSLGGPAREAVAFCDIFLCGANDRRTYACADLYLGFPCLCDDVRILGSCRNGAPQSSGRGTIYQQHCLRCHGQAGDGLGPDARSLIVPPENLQSPRSRSKTDRELMLSISQGVLFSPMHGWRDRLSEQEMRDVLSYIRSFAPFLPVT